MDGLQLQEKVEQLQKENEALRAEAAELTEQVRQGDCRRVVWFGLVWFSAGRRVADLTIWIVVLLVACTAARGCGGEDDARAEHQQSVQYGEARDR